MAASIGPEDPEISNSPDAGVSPLSFSSLQHLAESARLPCDIPQAHRHCTLMLEKVHDLEFALQRFSPVRDSPAVSTLPCASSLDAIPPPRSGLRADDVQAHPDAAVLEVMKRNAPRFADGFFETVRVL